MFLLSVVLIVLTLLSYYKIVKPYKYWQDKGFLHVKPWPIFGNMAANFLETRSLAHIVQDMYEKFPGDRYFGFHYYSKPCIMLRDPDLIKQICVKDFDFLPDRNSFAASDKDQFFSKSLTLLKGKSWRNMRSSLSPLFTTSKLKMLFGRLTESSKDFVGYFEQHPGRASKVNMKDAFTRYINDLGANLAVGVNCNSMKDKENEIYTIGSKYFNNSSYIKALGYAISPTLMKLFKVTFFDSAFNFMGRIIQKSIQVRKEKSIVRIDMLHFLMQGREGRSSKNLHGNEAVDSGFAAVRESVKNEGENVVITDEDIITQAVLFYAAGFDTSVGFLGWLTYELAVNQNVQEKLHEEIVRTLKHCADEVTYEALLGMKYLDMVISDRLSVKPYTIKPVTSKEKSVKLDVGTWFWIPMYALHRNPKYFPNPDKFDPERFNDENRQKIQPYTYLPFNVGPRACIASRLALLEAKVLIFHILSKFKIVPVEETEVSVKVSRKNIFLSSDSGPVLALQLREDTAQTHE